MTKTSIRGLVASLAVVTGCAVIPGMANAGATGNIGVYSKYVLRGITNTTENNGSTVMGGLDYTDESGLYAGYWGANLGYGDADAATGFENDFYAGWSGPVGDLTLGAGLIQYYYINAGDDVNGTEFAGSLGYGPVTFGMKTLLQDVTWGNASDTYFTLGAKTEIGSKFTFGGTLGYYLYNDDDGDFIPASATDTTSSFRHLDLTLSHPIGETGAAWNATYTIGGKDRGGNDQENAMVLGVSYGFDL